MQYIAFLRGINVGGQKKIKMPLLRQLLAESGFPEVQTYIQSGNLALRADAEPRVLERALSEAILQHNGWEVPVVVRTVEQLKSILADIPFRGKKYLLEQLYFTLLQECPSPESTTSLSELDYPNEELAIDGQTVYLYLGNGAGKAKLSNNLIERKLQVSATTRNLNTLQKMIALCETSA